MDSTGISFASIVVKESGANTMSDAKGNFTITVPDDLKTIHLTIAAIGIKKEIAYRRKYEKLEKVYVELVPELLRDFEITGLSAEEVIRKAVLSIPDNYPDSSYFSYATYRQYDLMNGVFKNLLEAAPVVMMRIERQKNKLKASEAFAIRKFWASSFSPIVTTGYHDLSLKELMEENPVYHIDECSLKMDKLSSSTFWFDTTNHSSKFYVIHYYRPFSSEKHGILTSSPEAFLGESTESGVLTVDRQSFALIKIERTATRNSRFSYYTKPNCVLPERKYFEEFISGKLMAQYEHSDKNNKWYLTNLFHQYTNNFFRALTGAKAHTITNAFEWTSDSVSRYVDEQLVDKFYKQPVLSDQSCDSSFFSNSSTPFYFFSRDSVYRSIK